MKGFFKRAILLMCVLIGGVALSCVYAERGSTASLAGSAVCAAALVVAPVVDKSAIVDYFSRYPNSMEVYVNGGVLFHDRGAADSYGQSETKRYTRADICSKEDNIPSSLPPIAEVDINALSYEQLKYYVAELELQPAGSKKADLIDALTAYKDNLKQEQ